MHHLKETNRIRLTRRGLLRRSALGVFGASGVALLQACGGSPPTPEPTVTRIPVTMPAAATEPLIIAAPTVATPSTAASPAAVGGGNLVEMNDQLKFVPDTLTIKVGDTVTWRVVGAVPHTTTCDPAKAQNPADAKLPADAQTWDSGLLQDGQEFSHTFSTPGDYTYFCIPHETMGMVATLTVTG